ncbi:MAG: hypothetical protein ACYC1U_00565 [Candidatus Aquicultorales bacterium]
MGMRTEPKYRKYQEAIDFIRENGYEGFLEIAGGWKNAYGDCFVGLNGKASSQRH